MAVSVTNVVTGYMKYSADIIATSDANTTTGNLAHGLPATPTEVYVTPLLAAGRLSDWIVSTINSTNIKLDKTTASNSGNAAVQARVVARVPHSMDQ